MRTKLWGRDGALGLLLLCAVLGGRVAAANNDTTTTKDGLGSTQPDSEATTTHKPSIQEVCASKNGSCEDCVSNSKCLWCGSKSQKCLVYPVGDIIPGKDTCPLGDARWGTCIVNYKILLISMGVIGGLILISTCCCIYCCCCRKSKAKQRKKYQREELRLEEEQQERQQRADERKTERRAKYDEIRQKYGLVKGPNPYQRFES